MKYNYLFRPILCTVYVLKQLMQARALNTIPVILSLRCSIVLFLALCQKSNENKQTRQILSLNLFKPKRVAELLNSTMATAQPKYYSLRCS